MEPIKDKETLYAENNNQYTDYLIRRWHKISIALYTITSHIKDSDQIKWNIRNRSLDIMSFMHEISVVHSGQRQALIDTAYKELSLLTSELALTAQTGLISRMNYSIVHTEFDKFIKEVIEFRDKDAVLSPLQKDIIHLDMPEALLRMEQPVPQGVIKDKQISIGQSKGQAQVAAKESIKDTGADKARQERREAIINLLKKKGNLGIKDFVASIKGCSEKTIQRDLLSMVEEGVLYKIGDRRWSTYSLARK